MSVLDLPDVTLCCVDTRSVQQALDAVRRCMEQIRFGRVVFLGPQTSTVPGGCPQGIDWISIPSLRGIEDYNRIMLREILPHVRTTHVLVVQWDGFVVHADRWQPDFLEWDYIGAPWYHGGSPGVVGNGGFSLRSRRLLETLATMTLDTSQPEDMEICVHRRPELEQAHGMHFAPLPVAQAFACEYGGYRDTFGFHGMHNFAHVMKPDELHAWLEKAPSEIITSKHARKLVKEFIAQGRSKDAIALLDYRRRILGSSIDDWGLRARAYTSHWRREF